MNFGNVLTAMVTPFNQQGAIGFQEVTNLVEYLLDHGTEGLVVAGTTGESPTLSTKEKVALFTQVVKVVNKRVPVIAGTGSNNTAGSIALTKQAEDCGVDAIMLVTPYYNKPSQNGMHQHFMEIANKTRLPVMLYNIPGRSGINMNADTIIKLSQIENIVSVKEASGDLDQATTIIEKTSSDFSVYCGDDGLTLPMLSIGASGVVSVASHIIGTELNQMVTKFKQGHVKEAAAIHRRFLPVMNGLFTYPSPTPVKYALSQKGLECGGVRLPLIPLAEDEQLEIHEIVKDL
ncbi:4-hydroxy-tetrahydrodipicolinate synthase [Virgibacillus necropolis]|uniref:4-hydroxy-tetrahydrodipicolinate synthase n=1 Tax=Virgibacillus necropolis TaxID=163877 RepID=A0A221MDJ3_9BACI|nr:4-hydroxy-tetrahydrodipicolinate synthase [Virgibacillus necropolis]ASN05682.1 4-hydroxy-tetrahydrodipicolinate synthase [Virgibacillus necropolis]